MESFNVQSIKIEKANALLRYRRLQMITTVFRFIELCAILIIVSRFSSQLPIAFNLSGEYFRGLSIAAVSPGFVFVVGNAIVAILFLKSGHLSPQDSTSNGCSINFCDESVDNIKRNLNIYEEEESKKQRKQKKSEERKPKSDLYYFGERKIHRTQSAKIPRVHKDDESRRELRRSATERCGGSVDCGEKPARISYAEDEMSSEEFRRKVEAFIARQQRFLREEEFSAVVSFEADVYS